MANVLTSFEERILPDCDIIWANGLWQNADDIKKVCPKTKDIQEFIDECITNIKNPQMSKVGWNNQVFSFGGENYGYLWYFNSNKIKKVVKMGLKIDPETKTVIVGFMKISTDREETNKCLRQIVNSDKR